MGSVIAQIFAMKGKFATKVLDYVIVLCPIMVMNVSVSEHTDQK